MNGMSAASKKMRPGKTVLRQVLALSLFVPVMWMVDVCHAADYAADQVIPFKTPSNGKPLLLHLYKPDHPASDKLPCILFFFGGGWSGGRAKQFFQQADYFRRRGIVAISAEYRTKTSHGVAPRDCVADGKSAIRWVRTNAARLGVDPDRIIASGGSAGGHVAACTGVIEGFEDPHDDLTVSSRPNGMVLFNPVIDTTEQGFGAKAVGPNTTEISPCHHVRKGVPPTLIFHGDQDQTVPYENVVRFTRMMKEAGNACTLITFDGRGHGFFNGSFFRRNSTNKDYARTMNEADQWLTDRGLLDGTPLPEDEACFGFRLAKNM